jgi:tripartite-type tricarboxylate transporter receptor subunit TctC
MTNRSQRRFTALACGLAALALLAPGTASAQGFFEGKTINLYIGFAPGGGYDYYGRLVGRYLGKHIPGNPTILPQNMPGAGSFRAANFVFSAAPKDGTALGIVTQTLALEEALQTQGVQYKATEFNWIGRATAILEVHLTWKKSKAKTIADAMQHEIPVAGTGSGSPSEGYPKLMNALAGTKFKIISGYPGSNQAMMAMEAGEVDGALTSWNTLKRTRQHWLANKEINLLVQYALQRHSDLPDVPTIVELGKTAEAKQALAFYASGAEVGRSFIAPPGLPADRVKTLRDAFDAMLKDQEFLAEVEKLGDEFLPASGEHMHKLIADSLAAPKDVLERVQTILKAQ